MTRSAAVLVCALLATSRALGDDVHWTYGQGHGGPAHWSEVNPEFASCAIGKRQSPIDIKDAQKASLPAIQFNYQAGPPKMVNNGHTIQVTWPPGSSITVGDRKYDLLQFHFHTPSEEAIAGKHTPLVAHFVHKDTEGKLAVVAVLFDVGPENVALKPVFAAMPAKAGAGVAPEGVQVDPMAVLPAKHGYYEFEGSLTTPPCSEGVRWFVLQNRSTVSQAQLAAFKKLYPNNARPIQPLNGRTVRASM
ncbi:MAG TPA: carbonic anhydrase family protein [Anaeromyxobacteraceae bacterium]|nr:carbonic anhydrase family protein [Anaeromyxobacteraceae bacterium]